MSMRKKNSLIKVNDEVSTTEPQNVPVTPNNESTESTADFEEDLQIVSIPTALHAHFECVVGKHVFIDKPWTQICRKKVIDHLESEQSDSCFWNFREKLGAIENENILIGYKPLSSTEEEFLICTTEKAKRHIEETQILIERELKQQVERSMLRVPGAWESKNSEKDIEDIKTVPTRDKITYKWKIPAERLRAKAKFEDSNSKSIQNEYVRLEPRPKEIFECVDVLKMDSSVQAVRKTVNREMQTIPRIKDNKCIQSVAVEEEMFQLQPITRPDKALDDFLEKHVPNLVEQLRYNELYDLYRDDYKLLKNEMKNSTEQSTKVEEILSGFLSPESKTKYVSSQTWHPTIAGVFAVSYTTNSYVLYKTVNIDTAAEEVTKSIDKEEKYGVSFSYNENRPQSSSSQPEVKLLDENYKEKITSLLNKEFVQRMRTIQVTEDEKTNEHYSQDVTRELRNYFRYKSHELPHKDFPLPDDKSLNDESEIINQAQIEQTDIIDDLINTDQSDDLNVDNTDDNEFETPCKRIEKVERPTKKKVSAEMCGVDQPDHHDSDTDSFYNIWGSDEEWMYGNQMRNVVRSMHRKFNKKYSREAREEKLFELLRSEVKYAKKKNKIEDMDKERMKLTKDMFDAGYMYQKLKRQSRKKTKHSSKRAKLIENYDEHRGASKRENTSLTNELNNLVIVWSINDNMNPKLILESPEEVCCVEFNPRHGNTVVGGLTNGQICIWDIGGKLEEIDSNDLNVTEREKMHHENLWKHMKWSLDVQFKIRIRPAALSAVLESHESTVTAIQWLNPMTQITPLGKLVTVKTPFSDQFLSASMDGTVKLWDLQSTPMPDPNRSSSSNARFQCPETLNKYKSPLSIYNNRLKPTYTIVITDPENTVCSPITALSFEIPLMQYNRTSNQPLVIGKRQFEYAPVTPSDLNRILVIGGVLGRIGVVTWNGYDTHQPGQKQREECKHIWWGHVHDGPINCIKRNTFYPDIHLVSGGHVVSIWSLNYEGGPVWWKRFSDFTTSVLWSTIHPAEFRVSNTAGNLQFWNLIKYTHQPSYTLNTSTDNGLTAKLSAPYSSIHFIDAEHFKFSEGLNGILNYRKNELISSSSSTGNITMIAVNATELEKNTIEEVGRVFQKEVDWRRELDAWNERYRNEFGSIGENDFVDDSHNHLTEHRASTFAQIEDSQPELTSKQMKRQICDETFKWYFNRKGPQTRVGKMREKFLEREKRHMIETLMKKKNVNQKQLDEYVKAFENKKYDDKDLKKIRFEADETYKDIVNKLLAAEQTDEFVFERDSKNGDVSEEMEQTFDTIQRLLVTDYSAEKEKLCEYIKNNPYKDEEENWAQVIELSEKEVRERLNDPTLLRGPNLRMMRRKLAKKYIDEGYKIKEWKSRKDEHADDRYRMRERNVNELKSEYGKSYNPYWDKGLGSQRMRDAIRMRVTEADDQSYGQSYAHFGQGVEDGDDYYADYLSLTESGSAGNDRCESDNNIMTSSVHDGNGDTNARQTASRSDDSNGKRWDGGSFKQEPLRDKDLYKNQLVYDEHDEYRDLETLTEQDGDAEENSTSNEFNGNN